MTDRLDPETVAAARGWKPPDGGAQLLDDLAAFVRRYVVVTDAQASTLALWIVHTWAIDAAGSTPYLSVTSAEKRSGKTRLLDVLRLLCRDPLPAANVSEAALFRSLGDRPRTLLLDEIDAIFGPKARDREDLRAMLNAGYRRGTPVLRCVGDGSKQRVEPFEVFGAKALAGIGDLPDTLADRSLPVRLNRRGPGETVAPLRENRPPADAATLRGRVQRFAEEHDDALADAEPELPAELDDRAQDAVEPLLAIADLAGGEWPHRARRAFVELRRGDDASADESLGVRLLADIRAAFAHDDADRLSTSELIERLATDDDSPWADWHGAHVKPRTLSTILRPYGIRSRTVRLDDGTTPKGYRRDQFEDAWTRYLAPPSQEAPLSATSATTAYPSSSDSEPVADTAASVADTAASVADTVEPGTPHESSDVADVAVRPPFSEREGAESPVEPLMLLDDDEYERLRRKLHGLDGKAA
ncbi:MAG: DUF3631 domain-containing protein [Gaiella sp.]|nr:DUF3631 domain-containing protein [Gaiella sp.]